MLKFLLLAGFICVEAFDNSSLSDSSKNVEDIVDENSVISFLAEEKKLGFSEKQVLDKISTDENVAKKLVASKMVNNTHGGQKRIIMYGTKWCGHGNKAEFETDLGYLSNLDECCHKHDRCPLSIEAGKYRWGVQNTKDYTISDCKCDDKFYKCLKDVNGVVEGRLAYVVGKLFFNQLQIQCVEIPKGISTKAKSSEKNTYKYTSPDSVRAKLRDPKDF
ncbi:phospholipase A2 isoform X3 [Hydra vulgaris]|uniref:Phospholipase A2 isoform X3 n=1 Tax=Hydra vulgaris TaxID=6087 RepID=A0ABM4C9R7_HYDVU